MHKEGNWSGMTEEQKNVTMCKSMLLTWSLVYPTLTPEEVMVTKSHIKIDIFF